MRWTPDELDQWWDNRSRAEQEAVVNFPTDKDVEIAADAIVQYNEQVGPDWEWASPVAQASQQARAALQAVADARRTEEGTE